MTDGVLIGYLLVEYVFSLGHFGLNGGDRQALSIMARCLPGTATAV